MKSHEISMKLEKKSKKGYLCYPANKYVFKIKPLLRDCTRTEAYLGHCQTCKIMQLFHENILRSSVLTAILNMFLFVGMNLFEGIVTGPAYNDKKYSEQKNEVEVSSLECH